MNPRRNEKSFENSQKDLMSLITTVAIIYTHKELLSQNDFKNAINELKKVTLCWQTEGQNLTLFEAFVH